MLPLFVYTDQACVYLLYFIINKSARRAYNAVFGENVQFFNKKNQMNKKKNSWIDSWCLYLTARVLQVWSVDYAASSVREKISTTFHSNHSSCHDDENKSTSSSNSTLLFYPS